MRGRLNIFVLMPAVVMAAILLLFILATILELPTNRGTVYSFCAAASFLGMLLMPAPCFISLVIGFIGMLRAGCWKSPRGLAAILFTLALIAITVVWGFFGIRFWEAAQSA